MSTFGSKSWQRRANWYQSEEDKLPEWGLLTVNVLVWGSLIVKVPIWVKYSCQNMCVFKFPSCKAARLCSAPAHSEVLVSGRGVLTPAIAVPGIFVSGDSYGWVCGAFIVKVHGGAIVAKQVRLLQLRELIVIVGYVFKKTTTKNKQTNKQTNKKNKNTSLQSSNNLYLTKFELRVSCMISRVS